MREGLKLAIIEGGNSGDIILRFISKWSKADSVDPTRDCRIRIADRVRECRQSPFGPSRYG